MGRGAIQLGATHEAFARNLFRLRSAQDISLRELGKRITAAERFINHDAISRIENMQRRVDIDDLTAFGHALGVPPELLLAPFECPHCHRQPPPGYTCSTCGATSQP